MYRSVNNLGAPKMWLDACNRRIDGLLQLAVLPQVSRRGASSAALTGCELLVGTCPGICSGHLRSPRLQQVGEEHITGPDNKIQYLALALSSTFAGFFRVAALGTARPYWWKYRVVRVVYRNRYSGPENGLSDGGLDTSGAQQNCNPRIPARDEERQTAAVLIGGPDALIKV